MTYAYDAELAPWAPRLNPLDYSDLETARPRLREVMERQRMYQPVRPVETTEELVPGAAGDPPVRVRLYRPSEAEGPLPALVYPHWGGFVTGDLDTAHSSSTRIADLVGAVVVSVDYRLAPEHPYPAPLNDCYSVLEWVANKADDLGVDPQRLGVGGLSAGGGLAAALTLAARDRGGPPIRFQYLLFPELDDRVDTVSARSFSDTPMLDRPNLLVSWDCYLGDLERGSARVPAYAAPARASVLADLPPAFVGVCEFDPLRDEGLAYACRLIQAGVRTEVSHYPGTFHASIGVDSDVSRRMLDEQVDQLLRGLGG
ncbi:alpha/beta hydrolase [Nocardiopsis nanhaiensis]